VFRGLCPIERDLSPSERAEMRENADEMSADDPGRIDSWQT
jgi:hypothetical protein